MPSNHATLCLSLLLLLSVFPSVRVFSNELALGISWPKHWSLFINLLFSLLFYILLYVLPLWNEANYKKTKPAGMASLGALSPLSWVRAPGEPLIMVHSTLEFKVSSAQGCV